VLSRLGLTVDPPPEVPENTWFKSRDRPKAYRKAMKLINRDSSDPTPIQPSRVVVVKEPSKARIVTISDARLVANGHMVRKALFGAVVGRRGAGEALNSCPNFLKFRRKPKDGKKRFVYSADLKKATDGLCHQWLSWLTGHLGIVPDLIFGQEVENENGETYKTLRGAFMGLPASWTILSMSHLIIAERVDPLGLFWIKGDDLIAYWTQNQWASYRSLMEVTGMVVNTTKSFVAESRGTFCEALYELREEGLQLIPTLSLRGFIHRSSLGNAYDNLNTVMRESIRRGVSRRVVWSVAKVTNKDLLRISSKFGADPLIPREFGGLGLPSEEPYALVPQKFESQFWFNLDKGIKRDPTIRLRAQGGLSKKFENLLDKLDYRSGVPRECKHILETETRVRLYLSLFDEKAEETSVKINPFLRSLQRRRKALLKGSKVRDVRLTWAVMEILIKSLRPTQKSLFQVWRHCAAVCEANMSKARLAEQLTRESTV